MQRRKLDCATICVAKCHEASSEAPAEKIHQWLRTTKGKARLGKMCLSSLALLTGAAVFLAAVPMSGVAGENERDGHKKLEKLEKEVASLKEAAAVLQGQVTALQTQLAALQSNHALALGPFVSVDPNPKVGVSGPNIIISGANVHIVSGSGMTNDNGNPTGLGNLIIGYDEDPINSLDGDSLDGLPVHVAPGVPSPLQPGDRGGSHNLVIGAGNRFTQAAFAGFIVGERNTIGSVGSSVSGGFNNTASGAFASVSAGVRSTASGTFTSVSGGGFNTAGDTSGSSVTGGFSNTAKGPFATVSAGYLNIASDFFDSITGGYGNAAAGSATVVIGGQGVTDNNDFSIAPQPPFP
jgi:hypothetical protein